MQKSHILISLSFVLIFSSCLEQSKKFFNNDGVIFGTTYHIVYGHDKDVHDAIRVKMNEFNLSLSTYDSTSVISKINRNEDVELDDYFTAVFKKAVEISDNTGGAFDITVAPLVNVWGFGFSKRDSVSPHLIDSLLQFVGMDRVRISGGEVVKSAPGVMLDASAIAKGYGVDVVADYLESLGINNYLVEIGGEIRVKGHNMRGVLWRVGIDKPIDDPKVLNRELQEIIEITDGALATSGNYRNFYIKDGKKYAHTIDPKTGYPVQHELLSVSVIASDCMTADAYATAFMVLGKDEAKEIVQKTAGLEAYFICRAEDSDTLKIIFTDGFAKLIDKDE